MAVVDDSDGQAGGREYTGFVGDVSVSQAAALAAVRSRFGERLTHPRFNDMLLLRFCRAQHFDVDATVGMLEEHLAFRAKHRLDEPSGGCLHGPGPAHVVYSDLLPALKRFYPHGFHKVDRLGRPIYLERLGKLDIGGLLANLDPVRILTYYAHESERQATTRLPCASMAAGCLVQTTITIMDLDGFSLATATNAPGLSLVRTLVSEQESHFPEISGKMVIVNAPSAFNFAWKMVRPLLSASTLERMEVYGSGQAGSERLLELIAPENLPEYLGGTCTCADEGGCLCSDAGPWRDPTKLKLLEERPFWEVLKDFQPKPPNSLELGAAKERNIGSVVREGGSGPDASHEVEPWMHLLLSQSRSPDEQNTVPGNSEEADIWAWWERTTQEALNPLIEQVEWMKAGVEDQWKRAMEDRSTDASSSQEEVGGPSAEIKAERGGPTSLADTPGALIGFDVDRLPAISGPLEPAASRETRPQKGEPSGMDPAAPAAQQPELLDQLIRNSTAALMPFVSCGVRRPE